MIKLLNIPKIITALLIWGLYLPFSFAQLPPTGLIFDDAAYDRTDLAIFLASKKRDTTLKKSLKNYAPTPRSQDSLKSCVGWAAGYATLTIEYAQSQQLTSQTAIDTLAFSPLFIYNQVRKECTQGIEFQEALDLLQVQGDCKYKDFDAFKGNSCDEQPSEKTKEKASKTRIQNYLRLFELSASVEQKKLAVKRALIGGHPVLVGMILTPDFADIRQGDRKWKPLSRDPENERTVPHAMAVVGFNQTANYFELMNSQGQAWGNKGFIRMEMDDFARYCQYAFVLELEAEKEENLSLDLRLVAGPINNGVFESEAKLPEIREGIFEFTNWNRKEAYRLVVEDMAKGMYLYSFNIDAKGKVALQFPPDGEGMPIVLDEKHDLIAIPNQWQALALDYTGKDYTCILCTFSPIEGLEEKCEALEKSSGPIYGRLKAVFGENLLPLGKSVIKNKHIIIDSKIQRGQLFPILFSIEAVD